MPSPLIGAKRLAVRAKHWLARATGCLFSKAKTDIHSDGNRLPSALNIVMAVLKAE
jgi:hypothetical protein